MPPLDVKTHGPEMTKTTHKFSIRFAMSFGQKRWRRERCGPEVRCGAGGGREGGREGWGRGKGKRGMEEKKCKGLPYALADERGGYIRICTHTPMYVHTYINMLLKSSYLLMCFLQACAPMLSDEQALPLQASHAHSPAPCAPVKMFGKPDKAWFFNSTPIGERTVTLNNFPWIRP